MTDREDKRQESELQQAVMRTRVDRPRRAIPVTLGALTLGSVALLLIWDGFPKRFPARAHDVLGALPLGLIALAYLVHQLIRRPARLEFVKAALLAIAFLFWAANQFWSERPVATVFNDIAVALFVLDVFLVIIGRPGGAPDENFGETRTPARPRDKRRAPVTTARRRADPQVSSPHVR
jgi:hypothetical protein